MLRVFLYAVVFTILAWLIVVMLFIIGMPTAATSEVETDPTGAKEAILIECYNPQIAAALRLDMEALDGIQNDCRTMAKVHLAAVTR